MMGKTNLLPRFMSELSLESTTAVLEIRQPSSENFRYFVVVVVIITILIASAAVITRTLASRSISMQES